MPCACVHMRAFWFTSEACLESGLAKHSPVAGRPHTGAVHSCEQYVVSNPLDRVISG